MIEYLKYIEILKGVEQNPTYHFEGDAYIHSMKAYDSLESIPEFNELTDREEHIVRCAVILHDIGKKYTTVVVDGQIKSPNHAKKGEKLAREFLYKLGMDHDTREHICRLIRFHSTPVWITERVPERTVIDTSLYLSNKLLYIVAMADLKGKICPDKEEVELRINIFREYCIELGCWENPYYFENDHSRYKYLNSDDIIPVPIYDDCEFDAYIMCGFPASGKSTYAETMGIPVISLDELRLTLKKKEKKQIFSIAKDMCREYLRKKQPFVLDATNITADMRGRYIQIFNNYRCRTNIIVTECSYDELIKRNNKRVYKVPEGYVDKLIKKIEYPMYNEANIVKIVD